MDYVLTDQQRKLVEENHNLIYKFACSRDADLEEFYDLLAIGLCKAASTYDPSRGYKFSTLAYRCMGTEYAMYWRYILSPKRVSPNQLVGLESVELYLGNDGYVYDDTVSYVEQFVKTLSKKYRMVLIGLMSGYSITEIADQTGYSKQYIYTVKSNIQQKWKIFAALA